MTIEVRAVVIDWRDIRTEMHMVFFLFSRVFFLIQFHLLVFRIHLISIRRKYLKGICVPEKIFLSAFCCPLCAKQKKKLYTEIKKNSHETNEVFTLLNKLLFLFGLPFLRH